MKYWHVAIRPEIACGSVNAPGEEPWVFKGVRPCARRAVYEWRSRECCERALEDARPHCPVAPRGAYVPPRPSHCRLTAARRPRSARTRTAPCPAAAPDDLPLAPAHVPAAPAHRPAQHAAPRGRRVDRHSNQRRDTGADGSARYADGTRRLPNSPRIDTYLVPATAPKGMRSARYRLRAHKSYIHTYE